MPSAGRIPGFPGCTGGFPGRYIYCTGEYRGFPGGALSPCKYTCSNMPYGHPPREHPVSPGCLPGVSRASAPPPPGCLPASPLSLPGISPVSPGCLPGTPADGNREIRRPATPGSLPAMSSKLVARQSPSTGFPPSPPCIPGVDAGNGQYGPESPFPGNCGRLTSPERASASLPAPPGSPGEDGGNRGIRAGRGNPAIRGTSGRPLT